MAFIQKQLKSFHKHFTDQGLNRPKALLFVGNLLIDLGYLLLSRCIDLLLKLFNYGILNHLSQFGKTTASASVIFSSYFLLSA